MSRYSVQLSVCLLLCFMHLWLQVPCLDQLIVDLCEPACGLSLKSCSYLLLSKKEITSWHILRWLRNVLSRKRKISQDVSTSEDPLLSTFSLHVMSDQRYKNKAIDKHVLLKPSILCCETAWRWVSVHEASNDLWRVSGTNPGLLLRAILHFLKAKDVQLLADSSWWMHEIN